MFVTLLADSGVCPDWAKVRASDSEPSDGESMLSSEMDNADLESGDDDFDYSASLCRCSLCVFVSGFCRVGGGLSVGVSCVRVTC